jgi:hypothetical protein
MPPSLLTFLEPEEHWFRCWLISSKPNARVHPCKSASGGQHLTAEDQLFLLLQAGLYLTYTRGLGATDAQVCYESAESLSRSLNDPRLLYVALMGQLISANNLETPLTASA